MNESTKKEIRQLHYGHKYSAIQLSKRYNCPIEIINKLISEL